MLSNIYLNIIQAIQFGLFRDTLNEEVKNSFKILLYTRKNLYCFILLVFVLFFSTYQVSTSFIFKIQKKILCDDPQNVSIRSVFTAWDIRHNYSVCISVRKIGWFLLCRLMGHLLNWFSSSSQWHIIMFLHSSSQIILLKARLKP